MRIYDNDTLLILARLAIVCLLLEQSLTLTRYQVSENLDDFFSFIFEDKYGNANMYPMGEMVAKQSTMLNIESDTIRNANYLAKLSPRS